VTSTPSDPWTLSAPSSAMPYRASDLTSDHKMPPPGHVGRLDDAFQCRLACPGSGVGAVYDGLPRSCLNAVDMILADGRLVTASAEEQADLFWGVRGGGGNFGVVTSFLFQLHPISTVYGGPMLWPLNQATEVMQWYREFITQAPEDINGFCSASSAR
jgi:hypothetical protein